MNPTLHQNPLLLQSMIVISLIGKAYEASPVSFMVLVIPS